MIIDTAADDDCLLEAKQLKVALGQVEMLLGPVCDPPAFT